jgi:hypothetical protein
MGSDEGGRGVAFRVRRKSGCRRLYCLRLPGSERRDARGPGRVQHFTLRKLPGPRYAPLDIWNDGKMRVRRFIVLFGLNVLNAHWALGVASIRTLYLLTIFGRRCPLELKTRNATPLRLGSATTVRPFHLHRILHPGRRVHSNAVAATSFRRYNAFSPPTPRKFPTES